MTKEEYANSIKELVPDWEYPNIFESFEKAIDFYYDFDKLNIFVQDIKTKKIKLLHNIVSVKECTVNELREYRKVYQKMRKEYKEQEKLESITKDFE